MSYNYLFISIMFICIYISGLVYLILYLNGMIKNTIVLAMIIIFSQILIGGIGIVYYTCNNNYSHVLTPDEDITTEITIETINKTTTV